VGAARRRSLVYFALLMALAHAASFAPPTLAPAMAVALVSPVSRLTAARKLAALIRESEKTERSVEALVALDLSIHDCRTAESDAYRYRARTTWPKVNQACGPSESAARALFEDGKLEEAALAFEAARNARPGAWMAVDELTAYVITKRGFKASAASVPAPRVHTVRYAGCSRRRVSCGPVSRRSPRWLQTPRRTCPRARAEAPTVRGRSFSNGRLGSTCSRAHAAAEG
jgi:hypothetical protein